MTNNVLENKNIPQVAMEPMNDVHRDELAIVNALYAEMLEGNTNNITELCEQWLEHTKAHFDREKSMMEKYGFPAFHCHQEEHIKALQQLESIIQAWNDKHNLESLTTYVKETWPKWYVNHISTMDTVTSAFIKQSMLNE